MPITVDNAVFINLPSLDFEFLMVGEATFFTDDVDMTSVHYETEDGSEFSLFDDGDVDQALEQWIEATVDAMASRVHEAWIIDCENAGVELEYPDSPFFP